MAGNLLHLPTHLVSGTLLPSSTCTNGSATNVVCHVTHTAPAAIGQSWNKQLCDVGGHGCRGLSHLQVLLKVSGRLARCHLDVNRLQDAPETSMSPSGQGRSRQQLD